MSLIHRHHRVLRAVLAASTILSGGFAIPAVAQMVPPAPVRQSIDQNGVDLFSGSLNISSPKISMGSDDKGLDYYFTNQGNGWSDNIIAAINQSGNTVTVTIGGHSDDFTVSGGNYISNQEKGSTLVNSNGVYKYTSSDGTIINFASQYAGPYPYYASLGRATDKTLPSGARLVYNYDKTRYCSAAKYGSRTVCIAHAYGYRINNVVSSYGYSITFMYLSNDGGDDSTNSDAQSGPPSAWSTVTGMSLQNIQRGGQSYSLTTSASTGNFSVTSPTGTVKYRMSNDSLKVFGVTLPGNSAETTSYTYSGSRVQRVTKGAGAWIYSASDSGNQRTVSVTDPNNAVTSYKFDISSSRMTSMTDALNHTTTWQYDESGRLVLATAPEGNSAEYTYDNRGNVISQTLHAKPNSGGADITTNYGFDQSCNNSFTCNQPNWKRDSLGNETDFSYDPSHGGVTSVTLPADKNGVRKTTTTSYTSYTDQLGGTIYLPTAIATCRTQSNCSGTSDQVILQTSYGSLAGNNFLPISIARSSGDGAVSTGAAITYDVYGNAISVDGPLPGSADTTNYTYDAMHRVTSIVSPDPDGSGPRMRRAKVMHYLPNGLADSVSVGTTDANGGSFNSLQQLVSTFDGNMRKVQDTLSASGTTYAVTQYGYDAVGRLQCTALRMDPSQWGGQGDACTPQTNGGNGPDRVTKQVYDAAGQVTGVYSALGTGAQAFEQTSFTPNGKVASVTDGNGNVTTAGYDGFDRRTTTTYPGGSYEHLTYDANGNVVTRRLRDGQVINYGYDALNRMVSKDRPNSSYSEYDQSYGYDLVGHLTSASDTSGRTLKYDYDALGSRRAQYDNVYTFGNATFQYDAAGRRTNMTWGDGNAVTYDYLTTGEMNTIRDGSGNVLVSFGYDDLGRRTSLSRANGTVTSYAYDPASRLSQLTQDLTGSANDLTVTFGYNPAGQIASRSASNDGYAWTAGVNADRSYSVNGLNQYTQAGSVTLGYDGRGNLTSSGGDSYSYTVDNQMAVGKGIGMAYDPLGRLFNAAVDPGANTSFTYDGPDLIAETNQNNGALLRRYVYGPGSDEPLIWYEGAGLGDRRWLHADERGSVIAVTNDAGNPIAINRYDEYGIPQSGNVGRFQYTGQKWLPALGLYDYKARSYSPTLGRFMQTDPIGYGDGLNWYNYVKGDPVNLRDPSGLTWKTCTYFTSTTELSDGTSEIYVDDPAYTQCTEMPDPVPDWQPATDPGQPGGSEANGGGSSASGAPAQRQNTKDTSVSHCAGVAGLKNARAFALDAAGAVASALPGEKAAVALGGLALGAVGLTNSAYSADTGRPGISLSGFAIGIAGFHVTSAGPLAKVFETTSKIAANLPIIAGGLVALQTGVDAYNTYLDYQDCRNGK